MSKSLQDYWSGEVAELAAAGRLRKRRKLPRGTVNFSSNDYLGLSQHPELLQYAASELGGLPTSASAKWGAGASPVVGGFSASHRGLEQAICEMTSAPAALTFSSGYAGNMGVVASLFGEGDLLLSDSLNHACLIDGCRLSRAKVVVYPHLDSSWVEDFLNRQRDGFGRVGILTESVFSMDGDVADLCKLQELAASFDCALVVDEAHASGVFGQRGGGILELTGLTGEAWPDNVVKLGTLSKAIGCIGGYVAATEACVDFLVNRCRSYLFSTAQPPAVASVAARAVRLAIQMTNQRTQLHERARSLRSHLASLNATVGRGGNPSAAQIDAASSTTIAAAQCPIVPFVVGDDRRATSLSESLLEEGLYVPAIRPPTVPEGTSRLRVSVCAGHTAQQIEALCDRLQRSLV